MFKSMKRIIRWAGKYRGRLYLGSVDVYKRQMRYNGINATMQSIVNFAAPAAAGAVFAISTLRMTLMKMCIRDRDCRLRRSGCWVRCRI